MLQPSPFSQTATLHTEQGPLSFQPSGNRVADFIVCHRSCISAALSQLNIQMLKTKNKHVIVCNSCRRPPATFTSI
eukprot:g30735.t1